MHAMTGTKPLADAASSAAACRPRRSGCRRGPRSTIRPSTARCGGAGVRQAAARRRRRSARRRATPAASSAATSRVLTAPASTATTTSSVASSVMRSPSTCRFSMPARLQRGVDLLAAAVHDDQRRAAPRRCAATRADDGLRAAPAPRAARRRTSRRAGWPAHSRPGRLVEAEHHVHVLHRLARRALHQVVDHRHEDRAARRIDAPADVAEVRVRDVLDLRQRRRRPAGRRSRRRRPAR